MIKIIAQMITIMHSSHHNWLRGCSPCWPAVQHIQWLCQTVERLGCSLGSPHEGRIHSSQVTNSDAPLKGAEKKIEEGGGGGRMKEKEGEMKEKEKKRNTGSSCLWLRSCLDNSFHWLWWHSDARWRSRLPRRATKDQQDSKKQALYDSKEKGHTTRDNWTDSHWVHRRRNTIAPE